MLRLKLSATTARIRNTPLSFFDLLVVIPVSENINVPIPKPGCGDPKKGLPYAAMEKDIYEFVVEKLDELKPRDKWEIVARETGMSLSTIKKIAYREVEGPNVHLIIKLARYFGSRATA